MREWVEGEGPVPCKWMFVGEAPAMEEVRQGRPFVGKTGVELEKLLREVVGIGRSSIRITNTFKYMVPESKKVTEEEWRWMKEELMGEIEECGPSVIVAMGGMATRMILGEGVSVEAANGVPHLWVKGNVNVTIIPTIHPAAGFHEPEMMNWIREAFEVVGEWVKGRRTPPPVTPTPPDFDIREVGKVMSGNSIRWEGKRCVAVDVETYGSGEPYMIGVATGSRESGYKAALVNLEVEGNMEKVGVVKKWVEREEVITVLHNALFDLRKLGMVGIHPHSFVDTMQMAFLMQGVPIGLKPLAYRLCGWKMKGYEEVVEGHKDLAEAREKGNKGEVDRYALTDPVATLGVMEEMMGRMYKGMEGAMGVDLGSMPLAIQMMERGMKIDERRLKKVGREMVARNLDVLEEIRKEMGVEDINPNSPKQMQVLYEGMKLGRGKRIGETVWGRSTGKNALKQIREEHKVVGKIERWRETETLVDKYVNVLPEYVGVDGRVHTDISYTRVQHSGRLASSKPNLMAQPVRTEDGRKIRGAFVAEPGYLIMSADYDQIEMRVMAHLSQDPVMMKAYREGKDIHTETACRIFGIKAKEVDGIKHRYPAKRTSFGIINYISEKGLARELADGGAGIWTEGACREMLDAWFEVYGGVAAFMKEGEKEVKIKGYVTDMWGRRFVVRAVWSAFPHLRAEGVRRAGSALISGGAQGIIKRAMGELWPIMEEWINKEWAWPLIQIHDDLTVEVRRDKVKEVGGEMKRIMEGAGGKVMSLRTPVEVKVGERWGEQKKVTM